MDAGHESRRLADALAVFNPTISMVDAPGDWLHANTEHIHTSIVGIKAINQDLLRTECVFPRFFQYTAAHLSSCKPALLDDLRSKYSEWTSEVNEISCLLRYRSINDTLWHFLHRCKTRHDSDDPDFSTRIDKILRLDMQCIAARLLVIIYNKERRNVLLHQEGSQAQSLLDLLQELLDHTDVVEIRPPVIRIIVSLSKNSGLFPQCLILKGVPIRLDACPVSGGSFGDVWRGNMGRHVIAIKVMRTIEISDIERMIKAFCKEAVLWRQLSSKHVLPFYGVYRWPERPSYVCLVSPWMENGNIVEFLERKPDANRYSLVLDVARGLEYLHSFEPPIVHGDLKGRNILITSSLRACVADFGLCTLAPEAVPQSTTTSMHGIGSILWMAPELLDCVHIEQNPRSLDSDIYAFACVCYEVYVGRPRFSEMSIGKLIMSVLRDERPSRPEITQLYDAMWILMNQCWGKNPASRPRATDVIRLLQSPARTFEQRDSVCHWDEDMLVHLRSPRANYLYACVERNADGFSPVQLNLACTQINDAYKDHYPGPAAEAPTDDHDPRKKTADVKSEYPQESLIPSTSEQISPGTNESLVSSLPSNDKKHSITGKDVIIAIMGPTGTGKSSFINIATRKECAKVGDNLESCTQGVAAFNCRHPDGSGRNVVFVDTPGFDDSLRTDYEVLEEIAAWLEKTYKEHVILSGMLYFHRIAESRMRGTPLRNLSMFRELCGRKALENVVLTTTMWDEVSEEVGLRREQQLQTDFWSEMMSHKSRTARFTSNFDSAWEIVKQFDATSPQAVQLQTELVDEGRKLSQTSAYTVLARWWTQLVVDLRGLLRRTARPLRRRSVQLQLNGALREQTALNDVQSVTSSTSSLGVIVDMISSSRRRLVK